MKIFISWSKSLSHDLALALRDWLPEVIQQIDPWVSSEDIDKGQRWAAEVGARLQEMGQGIICITAENVREPWLNFEAGALAKSLDDSRVRPILLDLKPSDITGPLAQFQATVATERQDMAKLVQSLNASCAAPLEPARLDRAFEKNWDDFLAKVHDILAMPRANATESPKRSLEDLLGEALDGIRDLQRRINLAVRAGGSYNARLGDGSLVRLGMRVSHIPTGKIGRVARVRELPTLGNPNYAIVEVHFEKEGRRNVVPADELRRLTRNDPLKAATSDSPPKPDPDEEQRLAYQEVLDL